MNCALKAEVMSLGGREENLTILLSQAEDQSAPVWYMPGQMDDRPDHQDSKREKEYVSRSIHS